MVQKNWEILLQTQVIYNNFNKNEEEKHGIVKLYNGFVFFLYVSIWDPDFIKF